MFCVFSRIPSDGPCGGWESCVCGGARGPGCFPHLLLKLARPPLFLFPGGLLLALLQAVGQALLNVPGLLDGLFHLFGRGSIDVERQGLGVATAGDVAEGDAAIAGTLIDVGPGNGGGR